MIRIESVLQRCFAALLIMLATHTQLIHAEETSAALINAVQEILGASASIDYRSAKEIALPVPGCDYEVCAPFGFNASGDLFSPLPECKITIRSIAQTTMVDDTPSTLELLKLVAQDKIMQASKQSLFMTWLTDKKLSPHNLFFLKLLLLAKDFSTHGDMFYVRNQLIRLMVRLSLTENNGITDPNKPLSAYLPNAFIDPIKIMFPESLDIIDTFWATLVGKKNAGDSVKDFADTRSFTGIVMLDATQAEACLKHLQTNSSDDIQTLLQGQGYQEISMSALQTVIKKSADNPFAQKLFAQQNFYGIQPSTIPTEMPTELAQAIFTATDIPSTIMANSGSAIWIGQISSTLGITDTIKATGVVLLVALKQYVATRAAYFKTHPVQAQEYATAWQDHEQKMNLVHAFLATEQGHASSKRLAQQLETIKNETTVPVKIVDRATLEQQRDELETKITALVKTIDKTEAQHTMLVKAQKKAAPDAAKKLASSIHILENKIADSHKQYDNLTEQYATTQAQLNEETKPTTNAAVETPNNGTVTLEELRAIAEAIKQSGQTVPAHITQRIEELKKSALAPKTGISPEQIEAQHLYQEKLTTEAYQQEAKALTQELKHRGIAQAKLPEDSVDRMRFEYITKPQYLAYIKHLEDTSTRPHTSGSFALSLFGNPIEFDMALKDFSGNSPVYEDVKIGLVNALTLIAQHSQHLQDNRNVCKKMITWYLPELAPFFETVLQTPSLEFFGG